MARLPKTHYLGIGLYSVADAARIIGAHPSRISRWVGLHHPVIERSMRKECLLTFVELMELNFIHIFRCEGVSMQAIRKAAKAAAKKFKTEYPFAVKRFDTDGHSIFATLIKKEKNRVIVEELNRGQYVFDQIARPFFKKIEYHGRNEAMRFWPMQKSGRIVLDPQRKFGKPIDAETGVPTIAICDALRAGGGQDPPLVAKWLDIPLEAVKAALAYEKSLSP